MQLVLDDFRAGMITNADPTQLPPGAAETLANVRVRQRGLQSRPPLIAHGDAPTGLSSKSCRGLIEYFRHNIDHNARLVSVYGDQVYATDTDDQQFSSNLHLETTLDLANMPTLAQIRSSLLMGDGTGPVREWLGGTSISGVFQDVGSGPAPAVQSDSVYTGATTCIFTITITKGGLRNPGGVDGPAEFDWEQDGGSGGSDSGVIVDEEVALVDGVTLEFPDLTYVIGDAFKVRCRHATSVLPLVDGPRPASPPTISTADIPDTVLPTKTGSRTGIGASSSWTNNFQYNALPDVSAFNGDSTANFITEPTLPGAYCVRLFTEAGNFLTGGSALGIEVLAETVAADVPAWGWVHVELDDPLDLSYVDSLLMDFKFLGDAGAGFGNSRLYFQFGTEEDVEILEHVVEIDLSGTNRGQWTQGTISLADIDPAERRAITHVAIAIWFGDLYVIDQSIARLEYTADTYGYSSNYAAAAAMLLIDAITLDNYVPRFPPGDYHFRWAYAIYDGAELSEGPASQQTDLQVTNTNIGSITAVCEHDKAIVLTANDRIRLYVQGPAIKTWRMAAELELDESTKDDGEFTLVWDGSIADNAPVLDIYRNAPPEKVALISEYRGRALYVVNGLDSDWLYISNRYEHWNVPDEEIYAMYEHYGGKVRIGRDASSITAFGEWGDPGNTCKLVLKRKGVWRLTGDDGNTFDIKQLDEVWGTISPRTVCAIPGGVVWLDSSRTICVYDGQTVHEMEGLTGLRGNQMSTLLESFTEEQIIAAFAVFDHTTHYYALTIPSMDGELGSITLLLDVQGSGWVRDTGQPNGAAVCAVHAEVPGVYAADRWGSPTTAKVYRLYQWPVGSDVAAEASIACSWRGGSILQDTRQFKDVTRVQATVGRTTTGNVTLSLWNNNSTGAADGTSTQAINDYHKVHWRPAILPNTRMVQVGVGWTADVTERSELLELLVEVTEKGILFE